MSGDNIERPSSSSGETLVSKKRIIICCDGTWKDSDGDLQTPSNVTRLARSIRSVGHEATPTSSKPIHQVVFYQNGVGTGSKSPYTRLVGGATGEGIGHNIREAYSFVCHNYYHGDDIFLIGFSRGAFTARSVSSLIRAVGLLTPRGKKSYKSKYEKPWPNRPPLYTKEYQRKLLELELTRPDIQIKCVAVWDTVGALGIPRIAILPQGPTKDYTFVDTRVEPNIEYAYQALALDEHRRAYHPTIWEKPTDSTLPRVLKQTWFPGVHSDVGGSYDDADLANLTLAWMVTNLEQHLSIDHELITREIRLAKEHHESLHEPVREWGLGKIHNSMSLLFRILGSRTRSPREYFEVDRILRKCTGRRLENTHETVHSSVRIRMGREGLGYDDKGRYDSQALEGWTMYGVDTSPHTSIVQNLPGAVGKMTDVVWKKTVQSKTAKGKMDEEVLEMPEDELCGFERSLLNLWPQLARDFDLTRPGRHKSEVVKAATFPPGEKQKETPILDAIIPERIRSLKRGQGRKSGDDGASGKGGRGSEDTVRRKELATAEKGEERSPNLAKELEKREEEVGREVRSEDLGIGTVGLGDVMVKVSHRTGSY